MRYLTKYLLLISYYNLIVQLIAIFVQLQNQSLVYRFLVYLRLPSSPTFYFLFNNRREFQQSVLPQTPPEIKTRTWRLRMHNLQPQVPTTQQTAGTYANTYRGKAIYVRILREIICKLSECEATHKGHTYRYF